jgi:hypothetical protein
VALVERPHLFGGRARGDLGTTVQRAQQHG